MPVWFPSDRTCVKVARVNINDTNVAAIFIRSHKQTHGSRAYKPEADHTASPVSHYPPPPLPLSPSIRELPPSHLVRDEVRTARCEGLKGDASAGQ